MEDYIKRILLLIFSGSFLFIFENPLKGKLYLGRDTINIAMKLQIIGEIIYSVKKEINGKVCHGEKATQKKIFLISLKNV